MYTRQRVQETASVAGVRHLLPAPLVLSESPRHLHRRRVSSASVDNEENDDEDGSRTVSPTHILTPRSILRSPGSLSSQRRPGLHIRFIDPSLSQDSSSSVTSSLSSSLLAGIPATTFDKNGYRTACGDDDTDTNDFSEVDTHINGACCRKQGKFADDDLGVGLGHSDYDDEGEDSLSDEPMLDFGAARRARDQWHEGSACNELYMEDDRNTDEDSHDGETAAAAACTDGRASVDGCARTEGKEEEEDAVVYTRTQDHRRSSSTRRDAREVSAKTTTAATTTRAPDQNCSIHSCDSSTLPCSEDEDLLSALPGESGSGGSESEKYDNSSPDDCRQNHAPSGPNVVLSNKTQRSEAIHDSLDDIPSLSAASDDAHQTIMSPIDSTSKRLVSTTSRAVMTDKVRISTSVDRATMTRTTAVDGAHTNMDEINDNEKNDGQGNKNDDLHTPERRQHGKHGKRGNRHRGHHHHHHSDCSDRSHPCRHKSGRRQTHPAPVSMSQQRGSGGSTEASDNRHLPIVHESIPLHTLVDMYMQQSDSGNVCSSIIPQQQPMQPLSMSFSRVSSDTVKGNVSPSRVQSGTPKRRGSVEDVSVCTHDAPDILDKAETVRKSSRSRSDSYRHSGRLHRRRSGKVTASEVEPVDPYVDTLNLLLLLLQPTRLTVREMSNNRQQQEQEQEPGKKQEQGRSGTGATEQEEGVSYRSPRSKHRHRRHYCHSRSRSPCHHHHGYRHSRRRSRNGHADATAHVEMESVESTWAGKKTSAEQLDPLYISATERADDARNLQVANIDATSSPADSESRNADYFDSTVGESSAPQEEKDEKKQVHEPTNTQLVEDGTRSRHGHTSSKSTAHRHAHSKRSNHNSGRKHSFSHRHHSGHKSGRQHRHHHRRSRVTEAEDVRVSHSMLSNITISSSNHSSITVSPIATAAAAVAETHDVAVASHVVEVNQTHAPVHESFGSDTRPRQALAAKDSAIAEMNGGVNRSADSSAAVAATQAVHTSATGVIAAVSNSVCKAQTPDKANAQDSLLHNTNNLAQQQQAHVVHEGNEDTLIQVSVHDSNSVSDNHAMSHAQYARHRFCSVVRVSDGGEEGDCATKGTTATLASPDVKQSAALVEEQIRTEAEEKERAGQAENDVAKADVAASDVREAAPQRDGALTSTRIGSGAEQGLSRTGQKMSLPESNEHDSVGVLSTTATSSRGVEVLSMHTSIKMQEEGVDTAVTKTLSAIARASPYIIASAELSAVKSDNERHEKDSLHWQPRSPLHHCPPPPQQQQQHACKHEHERGDGRSAANELVLHDQKICDQLARNLRHIALSLSEYYVAL